MLRAVIFDMDETLIDWSEHTADWHELRRKHFQPVIAHLQEEGHDAPDLDALVYAYNEENERQWKASGPPDWIAPHTPVVLHAALASTGLTVEEEEMPALVRLVDWGPVPGVAAFPDAVDVLRALRDAGMRIGLLTNAASTVTMRDRELEAYGLLDLIDERMTAGDAGHLKPHPHAFRVVLDRLGVEPEEAVMVGDRLEDDVAGGQQVGMRTVWVRRNGSKPQNGIRPDATITALNELLDLLDKWFPNWR
jgi:2-haloalkanoic acid dehalogenase type II